MNLQWTAIAVQLARWCGACLRDLHSSNGLLNMQDAANHVAMGLLMVSHGYIEVYFHLKSEEEAELLPQDP